MRKIALLFGLLLATAVSLCAHPSEFAAQKQRVVVIDAGHGGAIRPGAVVSGVMEKDINLKISLQVGEMLAQKMPELKVYLTRESDTTLDQSKQSDNLKRPSLANDKEADLFVSIHANAIDNKDVTGLEVIVLSLDGATQGHTQRCTTAADNEDYIHIDNIDKNSLAYIEAISMLMNNDPFNRTFGEIMGSKCRAIGRKFRGVKVYPEKVWTVLYPLRSPGVIIEVGFMTNPTELQYIASASGQKRLSDAISDAIVEYFKRLEQMTVKPSSEVANSNPAGATEQVSEQASKQTADGAESPEQKSVRAPQEGYTIQLMASATQLDITEKRFGSLCERVNEFLGAGSYKYKYCYGRYATLAEAKAELSIAQQRFKDAYIVQFIDCRLK